MWAWIRSWVGGWFGASSDTPVPPSPPAPTPGPDGWTNLGQCDCCGSPYYPYYPYYGGYPGYGPDGGGGVGTNCCPTPIGRTLFATLAGCDGGTTFQLDYVEGSDPPAWISGSGTICAGIGPTDQAILFRCEPLEGGDFGFAIYFNDAAQGPYLGTLVSCDPFIWQATVNLDAFGCACGDFTITITE